MKTQVWALSLAVLALSAQAAAPKDVAKAAPARTPVYGYTVVASFPHDPSAFTEGLFYQDGILFESTGLEGRSGIRKSRLDTGEVIQQAALPSIYFGEGIVE